MNNRQSALTFVNNARSQGKIIGFTSGTFDLLHEGHIQYLEAARQQCDALVVGVNTDRSVREYKNPNRPFTHEDKRLRIVSALRAVDNAFLFDEPNNNVNIELLRPNIYIKAGDYTKSQLSSAAIVESYGGRVLILPYLNGASTSSIAERIGLQWNTVEIPSSHKQLKPALFLDRDGTIVEEVGYLHEPQKVSLLPGVASSIKKFRDKGYWIVVVTNQPGIGMGYFQKENFFATNARMLSLLQREGAYIDKILFCPHSEAENCDCRKPRTGLLERAVKELPVIIEKSIMVGDATSDVEAGKVFGITSVLVKTGKGGSDNRYQTAPDLSVLSLEELLEHQLA